MSILSRWEQSLHFGLICKIVLMIADILFGRPTDVTPGAMATAWGEVREVPLNMVRRRGELVRI